MIDKFSKMDHTENFTLRGLVRVGCKAKKAFCPRCKKDVIGLFINGRCHCANCNTEATPRAGEKEYTQSLPYFLIPDDIKEIVGEKPLNLKVVPAFADINKTIPNSYAFYTESGTLYCTCNGITGKRYDKSKKQMETYAGPFGETCKYYTEKRCKMSATFSFYLPEVDVFSGYRIKTKSPQSIANIIGTLKKISDSHGRIMRLVCELRVAEKKRSDGKRYRVLELIPPAISLKKILELKGREITPDLMAISAGLASDGKNS